MDGRDAPLGIDAVPFELHDFIQANVRPVIGQAEINQRLQQGIPDTLFGPASAPHIDGVPLAVAFVHLAALIHGRWLEGLAGVA